MNLLNGIERIEKALESRGFQKVLQESNARENAFPIGALPKKLQKIIQKLEHDINFPIDFSGSAMLHAAATAIGNAVKLQFLWQETSVLYMAFIGEPGTSKSHPIHWVYDPITKRDRMYYKDYEKAQKEQKPEKPVLVRTMVSDTTIEAAIQFLMENRRGICVLADELAGHFNAMGRNQQLWLTLWSRKTIIVERKTCPTIRIDEPFVSMIGTMQTNIISDVLRKGNKFENGFFDRILLVRPKNLKPLGWKKASMDEGIEKEWEEVLSPLLDLELLSDDDGNLQSKTIQFSEEAEKIILQYQNAPIQCIRNLSDEIIGRIKAKTDTCLLRLCIPLQLLKWACGEGDMLSIDADTARSAIDLTEYYKRTAFEVWEELSRKNPLDHLSELKLSIYYALGDRFKTSRGLEAARQHGMPERTFKHWLASDTKLFKCLGHGYYEKQYKK